MRSEPLHENTSVTVGTLGDMGAGERNADNLTDLVVSSVFELVQQTSLSLHLDSESFRQVVHAHYSKLDLSRHRPEFESRISQNLCLFKEMNVDSPMMFGIVKRDHASHNVGVGRLLKKFKSPEQRFTVVDQGCFIHQPGVFDPRVRNLKLKHNMVLTEGKRSMPNGETHSGRFETNQAMRREVLVEGKIEYPSVQGVQSVRVQPHNPDDRED